MHDVDLGERFEEAFASMLVLEVIRADKARQPIDVASKRFDLVIEVAMTIGMNKKIELDLVTIDVTIIVHDHGLGACAIHCAYNV